MFDKVLRIFRRPRRASTETEVRLFRRSHDKIVEMEVRTFSNLRRPGVGLPPRRESSRPLLPQHARHCPVLEAGSTLGFMVYAPLEPKESVYVEYEGDGRYKFVYYLKTQEGRQAPIFQ